MMSKDAVMTQPAHMREGTQSAAAVGEPQKPVEEPVKESIEQLLDRLCAIIPDHPEPGITFRDLTPVFADAEGLHRVVDALAEPFAGRFDAVAGLEARGFLLASAVAYAAGVGLMTVRKGGKPRVRCIRGNISWSTALPPLRFTVTLYLRAAGSC